MKKYLIFKTKLNFQNLKNVKSVTTPKDKKYHKNTIYFFVISRN